MRLSGLALFLAGVVIGAAARLGWIGAVFKFLVLAARGVVEFLGAVGIGPLLAITAGFFWWLTRTWTENARARFDMDRTWNQRRNYRLPPEERV